MKIIEKVSLACCCFALLACSNSSENNEVSASENHAETQYSSEITSDEESASIKEESASSNESSEKISETASWTLDSDALKETEQSTYLEEFTFTILDSNGELVSFYGDYIQKGHGDFAGMMQFKKGGLGKLECKTLLNGVVTLDVHKRTQTYGGEDHDYTGVPAFYVSNDLETWKSVEGSQKEGASNNLLYEFEITNAYFKFATKTENALYLNSVSFASNKL